MSLLESERGYVDTIAVLAQLGGGRLTAGHRADLERMRTSAEGDDVRRIDDLLAGHGQTSEATARAQASQEAWERGRARAMNRMPTAPNTAEPAVVSDMLRAAGRLTNSPNHGRN